MAAVGQHRTLATYRCHVCFQAQLEQFGHSALIAIIDFVGIFRRFDVPVSIS
jgi:hypothetical protein